MPIPTQTHNVHTLLFYFIFYIEDREYLLLGLAVSTNLIRTTFNPSIKIKMLKLKATSFSVFIPQK